MTRIEGKILILEKVKELSIKNNVRVVPIKFSYHHNCQYIPKAFINNGRIIFNTYLVRFINNLIIKDNISKATSFACYLASHEFFHYLEDDGGFPNMFQSPEECRAKEERADNFAFIECKITRKDIEKTGMEYRKMEWHWHEREWREREYEEYLPI